MKRLLIFAALCLPAFAQVTTINGTDTVKNSRAVINTNFSNLQSQKQAVNYAADTGSADVYVVTLSPALASLADASLVTFKASATNLTTTPTLNVNALGAKVIKKQQNVALAASDIVTNGIIAVRYNTDCTCWQMQSQAGTAGSGSGTVTGPGTSTDRGIATWNSTGGTVLRDNTVAIDSSSNITGATSISTGNGTAAGFLKLSELAANGTNFRKWLAPDTLTADLTFLFPDTVPTANQVMRWGAPSSNVSTGAFASVSDNIRGFGYSFDGGGSALSSGVTGYLTVPYACTIAGWDMALDAGTATVDIWKIATGTAIPTVTNTITASALPAISTGTAKHSTTLTSWTTTSAANDIYGFNLNAVATATFVNIVVQCNQ